MSSSSSTESPVREPTPKATKKSKGPKGGPTAVTVPQLFYAQVKAHPNDPALYTPKSEEYGRYDDPDAWEIMTWSEYAKAAESVGKSLITLGMANRAGTNIIGWNSAQWLIACLGTLLAGGSPTGVYTTSGPDMCQYVADHCGAEVVFCENQTQLDKYLSVEDRLPNVKAFICFGKVKSDNKKVFGWKAFLKLGKDVKKTELKARTDSLTPKDLCTLIYTSGTTGMPKGVQLTHENLTWTSQALANLLKIDQNDRLLSYLPLSHIAEQMLSLWAPCCKGYGVFFAKPTLLTSPDGLTSALNGIKPTAFLGVPRVWEKIAASIKAAGANAGFVARKISTAGKKANTKAAQNYAKTGGVWKSGTFGKLVNKTVLGKLGLDECRMMFTAAAPISKDTLNYFASLGMIILEIYGMSECSGPATVSYPGEDKKGRKNFQLGSAGKVIPGTELKIDEKTGEICMRGPHVFAGYYKNEEATRETLDADGWLHSGDVGELTKDGFLKITDRIKELIITAGGENVPPAPLEGQLKAAMPVLDQACMYGDRQKFPVILFTLNVDVLEKLHGLKSVKAAKKNAEFMKFFEDEFKKVTATMTNAWAPKKFKILDVQFKFEAKEGDDPAQLELTPTQKMKRRIIYAKYLEDIRELYGEDFVAPENATAKKKEEEPKKPSSKKEKKKAK